MQKTVNKMTVQRLLIYLGITPKTNGYRYLTAAILLKLDSRPGDMSMGAVCNAVGETNKCKGAAVERCMRSAITGAFKKTQLSGLNDLYNAYVVSDRAPTLSDFIMYVVEYLDSFYGDDDTAAFSF